MSIAYAATARPVPKGMGLVLAAALVAVIVCLFNYFRPHGTIDHSWGALLVLISTLLMLGASAWIVLGAIPRWIHGLFDVLILLDVLGTGVCAYFLEAPLLLALMVIALAGWLWHLAADHRPPEPVRK